MSEDRDARSVSSQAAGRGFFDALRDSIEVLRELNEAVPPVIFSHHAWNGERPFRLASGDMIVGNDAIAFLRARSEENAARPADPRSLAAAFSGIEIVDLHAAINDPAHRYHQRARTMLYEASLLDRSESASEATPNEDA